MAGFNVNLNGFSSANPFGTQQQPKVVVKDPLDNADYYVVVTATISRNTSTWKSSNGGNRLLQFHNGRFSEVKRGNAAGSYIFSTAPLPLLQVDKKVQFKADGTPKFGNGTPAHAYIRKSKTSATVSEACKFFLPQVEQVAKEIGLEASLTPLAAFTTPNIIQEIRDYFKAAEGGEWDIKPLNWEELWKALGYEFMEVALEGTLPNNLVLEAQGMKEKVRDRGGVGNYSIKMWFDVDAWKCIKDVETRKVRAEDGSALPVDLINPNGMEVLRKVLKPTLVKIELVEGATIPSNPAHCISPDLMREALDRATTTATKIEYATDDIFNRKKESTLAMPKKKWAWQTGFIGDNPTPFECEFVNLDEETFEIWCSVLLEMVGRKTLPPKYKPDTKLTTEWVETWIEQVKEFRKTGYIPVACETSEVEEVEVPKAPKSTPTPFVIPTVASSPVVVSEPFVSPQTTLEAELVEETTTSTFEVHWGEDDSNTNPQTFSEMDWSSYGVVG